MQLSDNDNLANKDKGAMSTSIMLLLMGSLKGSFEEESAMLLLLWQR